MNDQSTFFMGLDKPHQHEKMELQPGPSGREFCFTYPRRGYYLIKHYIRDNHGDPDFIRGPLRRVKVEKDAIR